MVKLNEIINPREAKFVRIKIKEKITKTWIKDILLEKEFKLFSRDYSTQEFLVDYFWDNLAEEQKEDFINSLNILIEEDILIDRQPDGNYFFNLFKLAIMIEELNPEKINSKPFLIWKKRDYFNLPQPIDHSISWIKEMDFLIDKVFDKQNITWEEYSKKK